jgi:MFS transporter, GlpU family, inner membrane protein
LHYLHSITVTKSNSKRPITIVLLILAGEGIFVLPFILQRIFRSTFLDVFQLSNQQLGYCFSTYGIVALISYLLGGSLADRFQPRYLISISLWLTAIGGFYMTTFPAYYQLQVTYGLWGFSTIFLFWSALIKTTRVWGGDMNQGKGFGILDGGRGLVGAGIGLLGIVIFSSFSNDNISANSLEDKREIFKSVILYSSLFVALIGLAVFFWLPSEKDSQPKEKNPIEYYLKCLKIPSVWLLMIIILCAYVGYKTTDYFSQFAHEIMGYNELEAGKIGTFLLVLRAITAVLVGFLADKFNGMKLLIISFLVLIVGASLIASGLMKPDWPLFFLFSIVITASAVYAIRVLYYSVMKQSGIPLIYTGTAVGLISIVGYAPDIFFGPVTGGFLDSHPGEVGHQLVFWMMAAFSFVGLLASLILKRVARK